MRDNYKFMLEINGDSQQAYPIYDDKLSLKYEKESKQVFFRAQLDGKLKFVKTDYDRIVKAAFDTIFYVNILKYNTDAAQFEDFFKGKFTKTKCKFNIDDQIVEVKLDTVDAYEDVLAGLDKEFDLIKLAPEIQAIKMYKRPALQLYTPGEKVITTIIEGVYWEQECEAISDGDTLANLGFTGFRITGNYYDNSKTVETAFAYTYDKLGDRPSGYIELIRATGFDTSPAWGFYYKNSNDTLRFIPGSNFTAIDSWTGQIYEENRLTGVVYGWTELKRNSGYDRAGRAAFTGTSKVTGQIIVRFFHYEARRFVNRLLHDNESASTKVDITNKAEFGGNKNYSYATPLDWDSYDIQIYSSGQITSKPTEFGQRQPGEYYEQVFGMYGARTLPISKSQWGSTSYWVPMSFMQSLADSKFRKQYELKHSYPLYSCISVLLKKIASSVKYSNVASNSEFFYGTGANIIGSINSSGQTALIKNLFITQITNILNGEYDQPAQKMSVTLGNILDMLRDCFRCYWYLDGNNFRIEHIRYFNNGLQYTGLPDAVDTTQLVDLRTKKSWSYMSNKYEYDFENMPEYYQFKWADDASKPFEGWPIEIKSNYVKKGQIENISIPKFSTDIDLMLLRPDSFNEDGLALIATNDTYETYYTERELGTSGSDNYEKHSLQNGQLSFFDLVPRYYTKDLPGSNVIINQSAQSYVTVKRAKKQEIEYPNGFEINPYKLIKTELGIGQIEKLEINLSSELAKITILHDTEE